MTTSPRAILLILGPVIFITAGLVLENSGTLMPLRLSIQRTQASLPSSLAIPAEEIARGIPVISIYAEHERLFNSNEGLLTNLQRSGREWEIPAMVSYFEQGRVLFAGSVGLRVHGDNSGRIPQEQSFRLHFRRSYGSRQFMPNVLFGGLSDPIVRLVIQNDRRQDRDGDWWHFINPLAYDIARQVGTVAPRTQPVRLFINREFIGIYTLTEHVRQAFLSVRYGHSNFIRPDALTEEALRREIGDVFPLTINAVGQFIDLESLTRWFISVLFCATTEPFQAIILRDVTQPDSRWFWVAWDMDTSFLDLESRDLPLSKHDTFTTTLYKPRLESEILTRLINEDPDYSIYLARTIMETLNYRLTPNFLKERFLYYNRTAERLDVESRAYLKELEFFLLLRPHEIRLLVIKHLGSSPVHQISLTGPNNIAFEIDGYRVSTKFTGWYLKGTEINLSLSSTPNNFSYWMVNDKLVRTNFLTHQINEDTVIKPVFH